jgi:hypothetical protein
MWKEKTQFRFLCVFLAPTGARGHSAGEEADLKLLQHHLDAEVLSMSFLWDKQATEEAVRASLLASTVGLPMNPPLTDMDHVPHNLS